MTDEELNKYLDTLSNVFKDEYGNPITPRMAEELLSNIEKRRVGAFLTSSGFFVSTVFLPLAMFGGSFETMVFRRPTARERKKQFGNRKKLLNQFNDLYCDRYTSRAEALAGHWSVVKRYRAKRRKHEHE